MIYLDYTTRPTQRRDHRWHVCKDQQSSETELRPSWHQDSFAFKGFYQVLGEEKLQGSLRAPLRNAGSLLYVQASMLISQGTARGSRFGAWSQSHCTDALVTYRAPVVLLDEETDACENQVSAAESRQLHEGQPLTGCTGIREAHFTLGSLHVTPALESLLQKNENAIPG